MKGLTLVILALSVIAIEAEARRDQRREGRQQARIADGVRDGSLTKGEAARLRRGQHRVDVAQRKAMADGNVSAGEAARIEKMQDHQSKMIYQQKHDSQNRK